MPQAEALSKEEQDLFDRMKTEDTKAPPKQEAKAEVKVEKPAEKAAPEKAEDKAAEKKEQKMVPVEAVAEARRENRDLKKEIEALKTQVNDGNQKLQRFIEGVQKRVEQDTTPKFEDNPAEALKHENEGLKKEIGEIKDRLARQDAATQQGNNLNQFAAYVSRQETAFAKTEPTYFKAAEYVSAVWADELREAGYTEEQIPQAVFQRSLAVTQQAVKAQKDPAQAIWNIAKRNGFKAEPPKDEKKGADQTKAGASKLEQIAKGQDAAKTAGGGSGPDDMTLASLAQMSDDQIDKLVADPDWWAKEIRRTPVH